jgi:hypothetical protein
MRERERAGHNQKRRRLPASLRQDARDRVIRVEKTHFLINTHSISKRAIFSVVGQKELLLYLSPHGKTKNYLRPAGRPYLHGMALAKGTYTGRGLRMYCVARPYK